MNSEHHQPPNASRRNARIGTAKLAAAIEEVVAQIEEDWERQGVIRADVAERLHELREAARRSAGD